MTATPAHAAPAAASTSDTVTAADATTDTVADTPAPPPPVPIPAAQTTASPWVRDLTPARVFLGRAGTSYPTATLLALRADHAAARDAVSAPLQLTGTDLGLATPPVTAHSRAESHAQYLRRPDLGRKLTEESRETIAKDCLHDADVQIVIGDGLSATAVHTQVPKLLPHLIAGFEYQGWRTGPPILVHHCRVGVMNEIGDILAPRAVLLLIGERPGLATAESLSAYFAYQPASGHTDADRNLISNIHDDGVSTAAAVERILAFISTLLSAQRSGVDIKEPPLRALEN
jgi:ethanolamine ammonia-lyase small subunit